MGAVLVHWLGLLLATVGDFGPHFTHVLENLGLSWVAVMLNRNTQRVTATGGPPCHVGMAVERLHSCQDLAVVPAIDENLTGANLHLGTVRPSLL